jgi:hypothetical protein
MASHSHAVARQEVVESLVNATSPRQHSRRVLGVSKSCESSWFGWLPVVSGAKGKGKESKKGRGEGGTILVLNRARDNIMF